MVLSNRFTEALVWATQLHADQRRRISGEPYVAHLLRVTGIVLEHGGSEDDAIAALLHDAVEDQGGAEAREAIRRRFGEQVARVVDECSDTDQTPKPPWRERKNAYLAHLPVASSGARLVAAADKLDNVRSLLMNLRAEGRQVWKHFKGGRDGSLWYHREVVRALGQAPQDTGAVLLIQELDRQVGHLERLAAEMEAES